MDLETLTNHIKNLSKAHFDVACQLILTKVFYKVAINVDGTNDGGADFISVSESGERERVAYQLTVQKNDVDDKLIRDAEKALKKLKISKFYFFTSSPWSEITCRTFEDKLDSSIGLNCSCYGAKHVASLLYEGKLVNEFLRETGNGISKDVRSQDVDYRERTLHSYTILSDDAKGLKNGIYDDTILMVLGLPENSKGMTKSEIAEAVSRHLSLSETGSEIITKRIDSLRVKDIIRYDGSLYNLSEKALQDVESRNRLYDNELESMAAAQTDLMRDRYKVKWTVEDSKKISTFLSALFLNKQFKLLNSLKLTYTSHPLIYFDANDNINNLEKHLLSVGVKNAEVEDAIVDLQAIAATDPLMNKICRASMYIALEGSNPMVRSRALGVKNWDEFMMLVEPTVLLPVICASLYGDDSGIYKKQIKAIKRSQELGIKTVTSYFYINECAGHLLSALNYDDIGASPEELQHSSNAFVSNYFTLKCNGGTVPPSFMEYLKTFSAQVVSPRTQRKDWVRAIMTDLQAVLNREGITFEETDTYTTEECGVYNAYLSIVRADDPERSQFLFNHDTWALQHIVDCYTKYNEHWILLTYDRTLKKYGKVSSFDGWIASPGELLGLIMNTQHLSESDLTDLVHLLAKSSERTLSIGARMIDKILQYASKDMKNWQFKEDFYKYKEQSLSNIDEYSADIDDIASKLVEKFLKDKGKKIEEEELEIEVKI